MKPIPSRKDKEWGPGKIYLGLSTLNLQRSSVGGFPALSKMDTAEKFEGIVKNI